MADRVRILTPERAGLSYLPRGCDVVLLLGQSNMSGRGTPYSVLTDPGNAFIDQMKGKAPDKATVVPAAEPLDMVDTPNGIGPGFQFARHYVAAGLNAGRKVLLVPCAQGGTPLTRAAAPTWNPNTRGSLYDNAIAQTAAALALPGARVVAALWVQGETDGDLNATGSTYAGLLRTLIAGVRTAAGRADLPFIIGQMVPDYLGTGTRRSLDTAQAELPASVTMCAFVPGPSNAHLGDGNHYNRVGAVTLADSMFKAFAKLNVGLAYANGYTPAPPPVIVNDTFTRADSATAMGVSDSGHEWLPWAGILGISGNQAYPVSGADNYAVVESGTANGAVEATFALFGGSNHSRILFRGDRTTSECLIVQRRSTTGKYQLYTLKTGAVYAQLGADSAVTSAAGDVVRVEFVGDSIVVKVNGEVQITASSSFNSTKTAHGLGFSIAPSGSRIDNFRVQAAT